MRGRIRLTATAVGALLVVSSGSLAAQEKPRIAIMPLRPQRVDADIVKILDTILVTHVGSLSKYDVVGTDEISAILEMEGMKDSLGCSDVSSAAEIGGALDAQFALVGGVGKLGDSVIINLTLFDNRTMKVTKRSSIKVKTDENLFDQGVRSAVAEVFGETPLAWSSPRNRRPSRAIWAHRESMASMRPAVSQMPWGSR